MGSLQARIPPKPGIIALLTIHPVALSWQSGRPKEDVIMAIITISRGSFSKGKEVAEKVAARLGYQSVSREVILEASKDFRISQERLAKAIHDAPSFLERFTYDKQKYIAYVAAEILTHFNQDNVVYHGLAGHFFAENIPHLLKVRIIANMEDRIVSLMERNKLRREQAIKYLQKDDEDRKAWSYKLYGVDTAMSSLYDLMIHIDKLNIDNAVDIICQAVAQPQFKTTPESRKAIENLALAAKTRAALIDDYPSSEVVAEGNAVEVTVRSALHADRGIAEQIKEKALQVEGVSSASVKVIPTSLYT
jgi:cytidylate kinase